MYRFLFVDLYRIGNIFQHVESAPKELLGDFPRLSRQEACQAVFSNEAKSSGWTMPENERRVSRWDMQHDMEVHNNKYASEGAPGHDGQARGGFDPNLNHWGSGIGPKNGSGLLGSPPTAAVGKPAGLMDIKLNESVIQKFLSFQKKDKEEGNNKEAEGNCWQEDNGGDETPEVTPPVSPATGDLVVNEPVHAPTPSEMEDQDDLIERNGPSAEEMLQVDHGFKKGIDEAAKEEELSPHLPPLPLDLNSVFPPLSHKPQSPRHPGVFTNKGEKKDPRLKKTDPRKERQARREEEERIEREKDQRILDLDLGDVFGDLDLPPLTVSSPKHTNDEKYLASKLGLPFKPHIYHVAKEIDAGLHSHPPMKWVLMPLDIPERDYSNVRHQFSLAQQELDPRLRKPRKPSPKELPTPDFPTPKSDPRLKGRPDPRKQAANADLRRRSSEDSEGNHVYNPARELTKGLTSSQSHIPKATQRQPGNSEACPLDPGLNRQPSINEEFGDRHVDHDHYPHHATDTPKPYSHDQHYSTPDYDMGMEPSFSPDQRASFQQQTQFAMGLLHGIQQNMEAILKQEQMRPEYPSGNGRDPRMRPGMPSRGFEQQALGRGFGLGGRGGQWGGPSSFGRGNFRGSRPEMRLPRGSMNPRPRDPRVK